VESEGNGPTINKNGKELFIPKVVTPNYSEAQESRIRELASENDGRLNAELAASLAEEFGKTSRSVIAKIIRMNVAYDRKESTTKTGEPVTSKAKLVEQIGAVVAGNLDGLDKAPKAALRALADWASRSAQG
jgi:hypothetical protein